MGLTFVTPVFVNLGLTVCKKFKLEHRLNTWILIIGATILNVRILRGNSIESSLDGVLEGFYNNDCVTCISPSSIRGLW